MFAFLLSKCENDIAWFVPHTTAAHRAAHHADQSTPRQGSPLVIDAKRIRTSMQKHTMQFALAVRTRPKAGNQQPRYQEPHGRAEANCFGQIEANASKAV